MKCRDCINYDMCNTESVNCDRADHCSMFKDKSQYIKLPCKVGDTVYTNMAISGSYLRKRNRPYECKVLFIGLNASEEYGGGFINIEYPNGCMWEFRFSHIGKTVFLTKSEAEKALREREEK